MKEKEKNIFNVFISHRHEDKAIADIFRKAIQDWGNSLVDVFQSSDAETGIQIGSDMDESLKKEIVDAHIVLLIYTTPKADWSWCMYECGLAQDPRTMNTRIVVFHCSSTPPSPFQHLITVPMAKENLLAFTEDFHKDPGFFPLHPDAVAPDIDYEQIEQRANLLFERLKKIIPDVEEQEMGRYNEITLALHLNHVKKIQELEKEASFKTVLPQAIEIIANNSFIKNYSGVPQEFFDFEDITENMQFSLLIDHWKKESEYQDIGWEIELFEEIARAILNKKEKPLSTPFNSIEMDTNAWLLPILSKTKVIAFENVMEFDILFCSIRSEVAQKMI